MVAWRAFLEVVDENLLQAFVGSRVVDKHVALKVVFEAAEIKVGRSHAADLVVNHERFGTEHAGIVEEEFDSCL